MNTKKITALALAALMAAGTTATAFADVASADKDKVLVFATGTAYEENDDGLLVEDKDGVNPGDSIFYRLEDNSSVSGIVDKDRERINVYADWKLGKDFIEDVDIIYRKGNFQSADNQQSTGFEYEVDAGSSALDGVKVFVSGTKMNNATDEATKTALKAAITEEQLKAAAATDYEKNTGYVFDTKYYSSATVTTVLGTDLSWTAGGGSGSNQNVSEASPSCGYGTYTGSDASTELLSTTYYKEIGDTTYYVDTTVVDDAEKLVAALANAGVEAKKVDSDNTVYADSSDVVKTYEEVKALLLAEVTGYQNTPVEKFEAKDGYTYWVEIKTKDSDTTKEQDLAGTLYLGTTKNAAEKGTVKLSVDMTLSNRVSDYYNANVVEDEYTFDADSNGVVKFASTAEEVTLYFGENEDAWFTFNAQGALNFAYTTKFNKEIADLFPKANIDFITWTATPATNRTGDLYITADEDTFLYEVTEDGIKEVNGAKYDEDEGAWHIRTRKLAAYVISDMELDTSVKLDNDSSSSTSSGSNTDSDGNKANPDTGR